MSWLNEEPDVWAMVADRFAAEDKARARWLAAELSRDGESAPGSLCHKGHPLRERGEGRRIRRYCPTCNAVRQQEWRDRQNTKGGRMGGKPRPITADEDAEFARRYRRGQTIQTIAFATGRRPEAISASLRGQGIAFRKRGWTSGRGYTGGVE